MNPSTIMWGIVFGSIGWGFFIYGKKQAVFIPIFCGLGLMIIPYFISNTILLVLSGAVLAALPFILK